jgi:hypothetical protein
MTMKTTEILLPIIGLTSLILSSTASCQLLEFSGTFGDTVAPFQIDVKPDFIKETTLKASLTRFTDDLQQPDFADGPPRHNATTVRDFWVNEFDWFQVQENLNKKYVKAISFQGLDEMCIFKADCQNSRYKQFTTTVSAGDIFTHPIPLHFVHHRSPRPNAIPLLFLHGWPGSFLEVGEIIDGLTNPPNTSTPAFHVVAPSMPGFGFSPAPSVPGLGPIALAEAYNDLMVNKLNYSKYCLQGGDLGGFLLHEQAARHPESVLSALSNFWVVQPNSTDLERFDAGLSTPDEEFVINKIMEFEHLGSGYRLIMQTKPLSLATGMTDSPVGLAMWIYSLMQEFVQFHVWTPLEIVTWTMMYWIQGPYSSFRYYKEHVTVSEFTILYSVYSWKLGCISLTWLNPRTIFSKTV